MADDRLDMAMQMHYLKRYKMHHAGEQT